MLLALGCVGSRPNGSGLSPCQRWKANTAATHWRPCRTRTTCCVGATSGWAASVGCACACTSCRCCYFFVCGTDAMVHTTWIGAHSGCLIGAHSGCLNLVHTVDAMSGCHEWCLPPWQLPARTTSCAPSCTAVMGGGSAPPASYGCSSPMRRPLDHTAHAALPAPAALRARRHHRHARRGHEAHRHRPVRRRAADWL